MGKGLEKGVVSRPAPRTLLGTSWRGVPQAGYHGGSERPVRGLRAAAVAGHRKRVVGQQKQTLPPASRRNRHLAGRGDRRQAGLPVFQHRHPPLPRPLRWPPSLPKCGLSPRRTPSLRPYLPRGERTGRQFLPDSGRTQGRPLRLFAPHTPMAQAHGCHYALAHPHRARQPHSLHQQPERHLGNQSPHGKAHVPIHHRHE